jgi:cell division protein FtsB
MENRSSIEVLSEKVSEILQNYHSIKDENENLRNEIVTLKAQSEGKDQEIEKLTDQNAMKDLEIEEIVNKIESILG